MTAFFVAATVVTLLQFLRLRDHRLLPLLALFLFLALAMSRDDWYAARRFHLAAGLSGLAVLYVLPRPSHPPQARRPEEPKK
jgi:hypothetical protein